ncbi:MAG: SAM-dependent methyltransferase [Halobellus sp.]|uniref:SAM-dependent methyltransferase n=1 Tax=Halobellus sp. TaxID=1979212 RepID=UPI0035D4D92C
MGVDATDVYRVGTGMVGTQQLTREAWTALEHSTAVYVQNPSDLVIEYFRDQLDGDVHSVETLYREGEARIEIYDRIADTVVEAAAGSDAPIALAVYGHPSVGSSAGSLLAQKAAEREMTIETIPGVSSLGTLLVDLGIDPLDGLQLHEATNLLIHEYEIDEHVPLLLYQVGVVETRLQTSKESDLERFERLRTHLEGYYGPDHEVVFARSATQPFGEPNLRRVELGSIASVADTVTTLDSLYVPPVGSKPPANESLLEAVTSEDHLNRITDEGD